MLHRPSPEGLICLTQPHHAWIAGELARGWGNAEFGQFAPIREVCLGAEQHDIGWIPWEEAPTLNPETGYPHRFTELPTSVHIDIWTGAKQLARPLGRYATLLVSMHGTGLYERYRSWEKSPESARMVEDFLAREYEFQAQLADTLRDDSHYAPHATPKALKRNQKLVATWDAMSLILCQQLSGEYSVSQVPTATDETTLTLKITSDRPHEIAVSPWPFQQQEVVLIYEGRLLQETYNDETAMRTALAGDCWVTLKTTLKPGR